MPVDWFYSTFQIGLVLHLSTDWASLADWAFSAEFQDSGTNKFLLITGRIRLSILVLEKWGHYVKSKSNRERKRLVKRPRWVEGLWLLLLDRTFFLHSAVASLTWKIGVNA